MVDIAYLLDVPSHIPDISLDLAKSDPHRMIGPVSNIFISGKLEVILHLHLDDVGKQVLAF
jgi:hypothetical protein